MPALGADMDEGTLTEWLIKPGDTVTRGQIVAVVETTKAAVEIECWHDGVVGELLVPIGQTVAVGTQGRHRELDHRASTPAPNRPRTAATIVSGCGSAACSRCLAYGIGTSAVQTRAIGASRS